MNIPWEHIDPILKNALAEDLGEWGDITSESTLPSNLRGKGKLVAREAGIMAGLPVAERVFHHVDKNIQCLFHVDDGSHAAPGMDLGSIEGTMVSILTAERTALNFIQRLSGIATLTSRFVDAVEGTGVKILDTRKTTPQLRWLEKYAVRQGGGENHRFGLFDMVLIKDNHIDTSGSITNAVERCLSTLEERNLKVPIEVECRTLEDVQEALALPIQRIMLDNMDIPTMKHAVERINKKLEVEASGNISLENVRRVAETSVDFISIGSLTHSYKSLDISLLVE